uniref:Uncharacterized protein n=1 Tax=Vitis vinifera TaxID=29760 RepID=F6H399_VITVI
MNLPYNWEIQVLRISHRDTSIAHFGFNFHSYQTEP